MLVLGSNRLFNVLAPDELVWRLHDATITASITLAVMLAFLLAPYDWLRGKCVLAAAVGFCSVDTACVLMGAGGYWYWLAAQLIIGFGAASFYAIRSHNHNLNELDPSRLHCLRAIPRKPQDLLISLMGIHGSDGGYSLFAGGSVYRYRRGILIKQPVASLPPNRYHVSVGAKITPELIAELDGLRGNIWTLRRNCLTVLGPIWRRHSG